MDFSFELNALQQYAYLLTKSSDKIFFCHQIQITLGDEISFSSLNVMNMVPTSFFFKHLGNENQISSPNVICNYNSATELNFRCLISLEFTLWRRNLIFVAECNEYGAKNVSRPVVSLNI